MKTYRQYVKAANMIMTALQYLKQERLRQVLQRLGEFRWRCSDVTKHSNKFQMAIDRRWRQSANKIQSRISRSANEALHYLERLRNIAAVDDSKAPALNDIVAELHHVEQEFGELIFDFKAGTASIKTDCIVLEGMSLGPFEICLSLNNIGKMATDSPYRVIALEPNPAGSDADVTHPHVRYERLCEGDGFIPIQKAIQQGRLNDFFTIVTQILQTYNPDSPYVSLDDWEGVFCYDCGYTTSGDDRYFCEYCERDFCSNCSTWCKLCDVTICLGCSIECPVCNQTVCKDCTTMCAECEETFCKDCVNEDGLCETCQENRKEEYDEKEIPTNPQPAVQPNGLGQAPLPA